MRQIQKILSSAIIFSSLAVPIEAFAQQGDAQELWSPSESAAGINNPISEVEQLSSKEWVFTMMIGGTGMRDARIQSISAAAAHVASDLGVSNFYDQEEYLHKILLVDEGFSDDLYTAKIRVTSTLEDQEFLLNEARDTNFDSGIAEEIRPNWVLVIPVEIDQEGNWALARSKSRWTNQWKIPFNDNATHFIPATIDADDRSFFEEASGFEDLSEHFMTRYKAENIAYVAKDQDGNVSVFQWGADTDVVPPVSVGQVETFTSINSIRSAVLDGFWSAYQKSPASEPVTEASVSEFELMRYRFVSDPAPNDRGHMVGWIQFILDEDTSWANIYSGLSQAEGFDIISAEDHDTSVLLEFRATAGSAEEVRQLLQSVGFTDDLF